MGIFPAIFDNVWLMTDNQLMAIAMILAAHQATELAACLQEAVPHLCCTLLLPCLFALSTGADRQGFLDSRTVSSSPEFRSFLLSMCIEALDATTNSVAFGFIVDGRRKTPIQRRREECCFVFLVELVKAFGQFPRIPAGASLLSQRKGL